ncbi:DUF6286 domain-containing protein [Streptomyces hainanensis]|uniref:DUF6286 domain-containing protein n=1 Tax=Streptomyces hainanensis TaxID=402648 RepID=A0A4R4SMI9_9ACTN|nr:DUF6286 domain-containing protein [Streptomyces hainanensis]TDC63449.1 hypothetical protein E1283_32390 [Streptomyces hainanensis]
MRPARAEPAAGAAPAVARRAPGGRRTPTRAGTPVESVRVLAHAPPPRRRWPAPAGALLAPAAALPGLALARELALPAPDTALVTAAVTLALLGGWLVRRAVVPLAPARAGLDLSAVALLLQDTAAETPGVACAHVRVRRRRATVAVRVRCGDPETAHDWLVETLTARLARLSPDRPFRLVVRVTPHR